MTDEIKDSRLYPTNSKHVIYDGCTAIYKGRIVAVLKVNGDGTCQILHRENGKTEVVSRG